MLHDADEYLIQFSTSLISPEDLCTRWNFILHMLCQNLKQAFRGRYAIDRHIVGGSVRKHTAILEPDYDCVLYFNRLVPPFDDIIQDLKQYLRYDCPWLVTDLYSTKRTLRFILQNEVAR